MIGIVGRKALGAVKERVNPRLGQHRHPLDSGLKDRLEMVKVLGQLIKFEILGDAFHRPGLCIGLKRAQQDFACIFLIVGAFIRHAQHGHLGQPGNRLGHDIEMLASMQWHVHARHTPNLMAPHAGAVDDHVAGHRACFATLFPFNRLDAAACLVDLGHFGAFCDNRAVVARALSQCQGDVGRITLTVLGQIDAAGDPIDIQVRVAALDLAWRNLFDLNPERPRHTRRA